MPKVGLVCDSTCDLEPSWLAEHDIELVPLTVLFGDETFLDWVELRPADFYARLKKFDGQAKTSQPSPADFQAAYKRLADKGCEGIVVMTLASALSGTYESATLAAAEAPVPVRVVDSRSITQGLGMVVKAAMRARDAGGDLDEVERVADKAAEEVHIYFVVETMEYLVKGGRAGRAQGAAASLLNIKPVLHIGRDGVIETFKKVKGTRSAIDEITAEVARVSAEQPMLVTLLCGEREDLVEMMRASLAASGARYEIESEGKVGAVIGVHTGPEVVGLAYHPMP